MTITRSPLGSVSSTGFGNVPERGGAGGGGVACGVCARTTPQSMAAKKSRLTQRRSGATPAGFQVGSVAPLRRCGRKFFSLFITSLPALLCRFRQVVQHQTVRVSEILLHHPLNISRRDGLQSLEICIDSRRIAEQYRRLTEC